DGHVGGHARFELRFTITDLDDGFVGDDILFVGGRVAHLQDLAAEGLLRKCVHSELYVLTGLDPADVGLGDAGLDAHPGQIIGNEEQRRGAEAGGDRLTHVDVSGDDNAADGRINGATGQIDSGSFQIGFVYFHGRLGLVQVRHGLVI